jgi:hypothetical protein
VAAAHKSLPYKIRISKIETIEKNRIRFEGLSREVTHTPVFAGHLWAQARTDTVAKNTVGLWKYGSDVVV